MTLSRRFLLRGSLGGGAVMVGLPMLDIFLDGNGAALAEGARLPLRFGTWIWKGEAGGASDALAAARKDVCYLVGFEAKGPDAGLWSLRTGAEDGDAPSLDVIIGDRIGGASRLRQLDMQAGGPSVSYSRRDGATINPSLGSPLEAYSRVFGAGAGPDPKLMLRKSVLSGVSERRAALMTKVGEADRARLDAYFTSIRRLERQLALQLKEEESDAGADHELMSDVLVMALACNQTRVFNLAYAGEDGMSAFAALAGKLSAIREGERRLIDNMLVYAHSDAPERGAQPLLLAGSAGGRIRPGLRVDGRGGTASRVGLSVLRAMGVDAPVWGEGALRTAEPIGEILA